MTKDEEIADLKEILVETARLRDLYFDIWKCVEKDFNDFKNDIRKLLDPFN